MKTSCFCARQIRIAVAFALFAMPPNSAQAELVDESGVYGAGVTDVLNAMILARADLKKGEFSASCSQKHIRSDERWEATLYGAFNGDSQQYRFETKGDSRLGIIPSNMSPDKADIGVSVAKLHKSVSLILQNREYMIEWYGLGEPSSGDTDRATCHLEFRDRGTSPSLIGSVAINPEAAGLIDATSIDHMEPVEALLKRFALDASSVKLVDHTPSGLQVVYNYPNATRRVLYIDRDNGFTIRRSVLSVLDESGNELAQPRIESAAAWASRAGVWLPIDVTWFRLKSDGAIADTRYA